MNDKIIFWLNANMLFFGLAHNLQKTHDCELYAKPKFRRNASNQKIILSVIFMNN